MLKKGGEMLPRKITNYFELAAEMAQSKDDRRTFLLGAVAVRADGALVKAVNGPSTFPLREAHAEKRISSKLDPGSVVYVVRVRVGDKEFGMARPCWSCLRALHAKGVKRIYYTISQIEYGVLDLTNWNKVKKLYRDTKSPRRSNFFNQKDCL